MLRHWSDCFEAPRGVHRCTPTDPQYEIKSDKTDHIAVHKGAGLHEIAVRRRRA